MMQKSPRGTAGIPWRWTVAGLLVLLLIFLGVRAAAAENLGPGGGTRVIVGDEVIGDYRLLITSAPNPAVVGPVTFVVRVSDTQTGAKIRDAQVEVVLALAQTGQSVRQTATHADAGSEVDYAAHIPLEQEGTWDGIVRVTGAAGSSEVTFVQRVTAQRSYTTVILVGIPFLAILVVFGAMWYARSGERKTTPG